MYVLARKYRPRKLSDLIGQNVVVQTITNAIKLGKLHHAYLFVGNHGCGKTSAARTLAAMENCERSPGLNPCGNCSICNAIFDGKHADVEEIDAASGAGKVEQIRELKTSAMYSPVDGAKEKYFILDEAHAMSASSAEALLKIIEEPPPRVRFILCTTEFESMSDTIVSRCQVHEFRKVFWRQIADHLEMIAKKENISFDKDAINLCAKMSNGSVRNALQNLDKVISFSGANSITSEDAQKVFASVSEVILFDLVDEVIGLNNKAKPDATRGFKIINNMLSNGTSFRIICDGISELLRQMMIGLTCNSAAEMINLSEEGKRRFKNQLHHCKNISGILSSLNKLTNARTAVDYGLSPEISLQQWFLESVFAFYTV